MIDLLLVASIGGSAAVALAIIYANRKILEQNRDLMKQQIKLDSENLILRFEDKWDSIADLKMLRAVIRSSGGRVKNLESWQIKLLLDHLERIAMSRKDGLLLSDHIEKHFGAELKAVMENEEIAKEAEVKKEEDEYNHPYSNLISLLEEMYGMRELGGGTIMSRRKKIIFLSVLLSSICVLAYDSSQFPGSPLINATVEGILAVGLVKGLWMGMFWGVVKPLYRKLRNTALDKKVKLAYAGKLFDLGEKILIVEFFTLPFLFLLSVIVQPPIDEKVCLEMIVWAIGGIATWGISNILKPKINKIL